MDRQRNGSRSLDSQINCLLGPSEYIYIYCIYTCIPDRQICTRRFCTSGTTRGKNEGKCGIDVREKERERERVIYLPLLYFKLSQHSASQELSTLWPSCAGPLSPSSPSLAFSLLRACVLASKARPSIQPIGLMDYYTPPPT